ncbi:hypothetical protein MMJ46_09475 [Enterococcus cecorum]|uniref:hypothetical protein n=1 Tax=Enterococcus cecorum TaxID=44008 RepID=UPI001FAC32AB|nr:hypothetical protein [Enterococcus cecorum]MCJ0597501.1 hypothetical protein [Enterococcus cecorum]
MYYSAKEIAELLGVSQTLVRQSIKELGLTYAKQSDGGRFRQITESDLAILFDYITRNWKVGRAEQKKDDLAKQGIDLVRPSQDQQEQPHQQTKDHADNKEQQIALLNAIIDDLKADKEQLQTQIEHLTRLLEQQQVLNLRTQKQLETTVTDLEKEKSKTWWQRSWHK